ncbi:hypothetical protein [Hydrogenibacillus schlegelii]|uniref:SurA N-terminal domain-containing protein n=2 Tax=Hydrogenibacillus schlegelii TaxID=1484 RepID=A0A132MKT6_HYDSH|nr:hypothetical protein [Hydrogenibacillus schlegelii]KWW98365.1 hypothetical protein TR75_09135 [Hydrogenibacillus schlegelii]OAR04031.1 hypothetical protein SA87_10090 [Hydrogenibacillus schlegelii]
MLLLLTSLSFGILFTTANFPTDHQQRVSENQVVARGKGFVIQAKDFVEYKTHVKTMLETAGRPFDTSNNDLIKEMIQRELLIRYAEEKGIRVTDEEARQFLQEQRTAWDQSPEARRYLDALIRAKGFTSNDAYWNDPSTLQMYKRTLLLEKLLEHLHQTGELNENQTLENLEAELYKRANIHIDTNVLSQLDQVQYHV